ncbi:MAG: hypothetical protein Q8O28_02560 [Smithellaceae bacterium]|nr:hypothetical protein [Smithellaceae bacterium]
MFHDENFKNYHAMWDEHGVKLTSKLEITQDILDQVDGQNEVCDIIWAINAANQSDKSSANLSTTVMGQIRKLSHLLLNHKGKFKNHRSVEKRALSHYKTDPQNSFIQRQPKIRNMLEGYINKNSIDRNNTRSVADSLAQCEIPTWDEIQAIYKENAKPGERIAPDRLKELIEKLFQEQERKLRPNWWEETLKILRRIGK